MQSFEELDCWIISRSIRKKISKLVKQFPVEEKYRLTDQILRSSRSVHANVAEGFGRFHYQENIQFCRHSRGSLMETLDHLICANDEGYISIEEFENIKTEIKTCLHKLNSFILYLKKAKQEYENNQQASNQTNNQ